MNEYDRRTTLMRSSPGLEYLVIGDVTSLETGRLRWYRYRAGVR